MYATCFIMPLLHKLDVVDEQIEPHEGVSKVLPESRCTRSMCEITLSLGNHRLSVDGAEAAVGS